jgi:pimeloyl-ACP methyl ester carboxylesterase
MADGLLLIHAFPVDARMWEGQARTVGDRLPVLAPHLPGFGGTEGTGRDVMTMEHAAERCVEMMNGAGVGRALACGLSMGGYVAFELWRRHPDRVAGMVLANTRPGPDDDAGRERRRALAERLRAEGNGFLVETPPPLLSEGAADDLLRTVKDWIAEQPAQAIAAASLGMAERPDSTPDLPGISVPTLVISASGDTLIPPEASRPMADALPDGRYEEIEGAGHLSNLEAPGAFDDLLEGHLKRCDLL